MFCEARRSRAERRSPSTVSSLQLIVYNILSLESCNFCAGCACVVRCESHLRYKRRRVFQTFLRSFLDFINHFIHWFISFVSSSSRASHSVSSFARFRSLVDRRSAAGAAYNADVIEDDGNTLVDAVVRARSGCKRRDRRASTEYPVACSCRELLKFARFRISSTFERVDRFGVNRRLWSSSPIITIVVSIEIIVEKCVTVKFIKWIHLLILFGNM